MQIKLSCAPRAINDSDDSSDYSASPCISVCVMNAASGLCEGCLRTLDEIAAWSSASDERKHSIWQHIQQRRATA